MIKKSVSKEIGLGLLKIATIVLEYVCRVLYLCMPLCVFMLFMSLRKKCDTVRVINNVVDETAVFQHVYPGVLLVLNEPKALQANTKKLATRVELFLSEYKYTILAGLLLVILLAIAL